MPTSIKVEGYKEFQRDLKAAMGKLPKALGEAHKNIGRFVIERLEPAPNPRAIGSGKGAMPRPSATKREVVILVGGSHRTHGHKQQWGKVQVDPFHQPSGARPYIKQTAEDHEGEILELLWDELEKVVRPAFHE